MKNMTITFYSLITNYRYRQSLCCLLAIYIVMAIFGTQPSLFAHEEPNKTLRERFNTEESRKRFARANIHTMTNWKHEIKDGVPTGKKTKTIVQEYDVNGRLLLISAFKNDTLSESAIFSYNSRGDIITDVDLTDSGTVAETNVFLYDSEGRVTRGYAYDGNGILISRFEHRFDPARRKIEFVKYNRHDSIEYTIEYLYHNNYDVCEYSTAFKKAADGAPLIRVEKFFDSTGLTIEKKVFQLDKKSFSRFRYAYTTDGIIKEIVKFKESDSVETISRYTFNPDGTYAELRTTDSNGNLMTMTSFEYQYLRVVR